MKVLIGTTNPSKVKRFEDLLAGFDVEFCTLRDLKITAEPDETGRDPLENAVLKAKFYARYFDVVLCNDSGLYFEGLALNDPRQPGLHVRTPKGGARLDDEAMIGYYAALISSLGGRVSAYYLDGIAVYNRGRIFSFMDADTAVKTDSFYMVDVPSGKRHPGWPLDSLSVVKRTGRYFADCDESEAKDNIFVDDYRKRITAFLADALGKL